MDAQRSQMARQPPGVMGGGMGGPMMGAPPGMYGGGPGMPPMGMPPMGGGGYGGVSDAPLTRLRSSLARAALPLRGPVAVPDGARSGAGPCSLGFVLVLSILQWGARTADQPPMGGGGGPPGIQGGNRYAPY